MNTNIIFLQALAEPEYSRIEFWKQKQKESSFSEIVFWKKLNNSLDFYFDKINFEIERRNEMFLKAGKEPQYSNFGLSLFNETNCELNADFPIDNSILIELRNKLLEWAEEIKPFIYYYNYTPKNVIIANYSLLKHFELLKNLNIVSFNYELRNKPAEQINEFLDFHLRNFKRQYEKFSNWNELLAEWFRHTKKQMPATFTPHQKDNFLIWFESQNKNTIETKKVNEPKAPVVALFCNFLNDANVMRKDESESVQLFCKKVCIEFKIPFTVRIGKAYYKCHNKSNTQKVIKMILPMLTKETADKIVEYLNRKQPEKQNLFV